MASYRKDSQCPDNLFLSPAKVFAMLKSKVQSKEQIACGLREQHKADLQQTLGETLNNWESNENIYRFGELEALTISPTKTPKKSLDYSYPDCSGQTVEVPFLSQRENGFRPPSRQVMESTVVLPRYTRTDSLSTREYCEHDASFMETTSVSSSSPVRMKFRKRKADQEINRVCSNVVFTSESSGDNRENEEVDLFTPRKARMQRCVVSLEKLNSPKMFAYLKKGVSRGVLEQEESDDFIKPGEPPDKVVHASYGCRANVDKIDKYNASRRGPQIQNLVTQDTSNFADDESDISYPEETLSSSVVPVPVLFEDSVLLKSPRIFIPKKNNTVLINKKWPKFTPVPLQNTVDIRLKEWFLRRKHKDLFVEGIHVENNTPWNSNIIVERLSSTVLKTLSGKIYSLVGKMKLDADSDLPIWFQRMFVNGFPANWKALFEKCLSELKDRGKDNTKNRSKITRTTTEKTRKQTPEKNTVRTSKYKTGNLEEKTFIASGKVTRSGRTVKPPLEHWKGGRVILDRDMNVTIFEGYNNSVVIYDMSIEKSNGTSQAYLLSDEGQKGHEPSKDGVKTAPMKKVKTSKSRLEENTSVLIKAPKVKMQNNCISSSKEKWNNEKQPPSRKPKKQPVKRSQTKECSASPVRRSRRKQISPHFYAVDDQLVESEDEQEEEEKDVDEQVSNNTQSQHITKKIPVLESKTILNTPPPRRSMRKGISRMFYGFHEEISSFESGEEQELRQNHPTSISHEPSSPEQEKAKEGLSTLTKSRKSHRKNIKPLLPTNQTHFKKKLKRGHNLSQDTEDDAWMEDELEKLQQALNKYPSNMPSYWEKVAKMVGTRSAMECHNKDMSLQNFHTHVETRRETQKKKVAAPKASGNDKDHALISAGLKTFKRKQQVRQFLETMPRENTANAFSAPQNNRFELPSNLSEEDFEMGNPEPVTPLSQYFPKVRTPRAGLAANIMFSPNRNEEDKYVHEFQKMDNKNQGKSRKKVKAKNDIPTSSAKRGLKPLKNPANDSFIIWEMIPEKPSFGSDSGEERDFYFSDVE
ncbi:mis18-binding protein 1 isoform X3 [Stigmatopora argus]